MGRVFAVAVVCSTLLAGCGEAPPPERVIDVVVDEVVRESYQSRSRYVGRLQAQDDVAIRARVTGYLQKRWFHEGDLVEAGTVLYSLDPSEYEAALARANADLSAALANQANVERNYKRGRDLLPRGAISQAEMDDLTAAKLDADARIEAAKAQVASAEVNLGFTSIVAPISGRTGRSSASVGDLVGPGSGDLTTLVSIDPIEALFQVSEATYLATIGDHMRDAFDPQALAYVAVTLELANGRVYPEEGRLDYFANRIDQGTGTLEARALIPNPHGLLVPGQYVRVILRNTRPLEGLFLPQAAVQADQQGSFVLVVDSDNAVRRRNVELGERMGERVLVRQGVGAGERVIVRGLQAVRPGLVVTTTSLADTASETGE